MRPQKMAVFVLGLFNGAGGDAMINFRSIELVGLVASL
jgi:hypothetical protein